MLFAAGCLLGWFGLCEWIVVGDGWNGYGRGGFLARGS